MSSNFDFLSWSPPQYSIPSRMTCTESRNRDMWISSMNWKMSRRSLLQSAFGLAATSLLDINVVHAGELSKRSPLRFGVLADVQYADAPPKNTRYYREALDKLRQCVNALNQQSLSFVVQLGDLIDREWENFDPALAELSRLRAPLFHVVGNHDYAVRAHEKSQVPTKLNLTPTYYHFDVGKTWRFIVLDGNRISTFATSPQSPEHQQAEAMIRQCEIENAPNGKSYNGGIDATQLDWLHQTLTEAQQNGQRVIIFCHYPIAPINSHNLLNDRAVRTLILDYPCVQAWMNGHNHHGNYTKHNGLHFVNFCGMVETRDTTAWAVVTLENHQIKITGYGREPNRILNLRQTT